jgi:Trp operon repressor
MPHISKRKLDKQTEKQLYDALVFTFSKLDLAESRQILGTVLTETERLMLAKRLGVMLLLDENLSDRQIAEALKITPPTIQKIELQISANRTGGYLLLLAKLSSWRDFAVFKSSLEKLGSKALKYIARGSGGRI